MEGWCGGVKNLNSSEAISVNLPTQNGREPFNLIGASSLDIITAKICGLQYRKDNSKIILQFQGDI